MIRAVRKAAAALILVAGLIGAGAIPANASTPQTTPQPSPSATLRQDPAGDLRRAVRGVRTLYRAEVAMARAQYRLTMAPARTARRAGLAEAASSAQRDAVAQTFAKNQKAAAETLAAAKTAAANKRDATISAALSSYLAATGQTQVLNALKAYRSAVKLAESTLSLALDSAKAAYRTDTADERSDLAAAIASGTSAAERAQAWREFSAATSDERSEYRHAVSRARATHKSALVTARAAFRAATGTPVARILRLPYRI